jgi:hypothetical protein
MRKELSFGRPQSHEELLNESFWWSNFSLAIGSAFSKARAVALHKAGLCRIKDIWNNGAFLPAGEVSRLYSLRNQEFQAWDILTQAMTGYWGTLMNLDQWSSLGECFKILMASLNLFFSLLVVGTSKSKDHLRTFISLLTALSTPSWNQPTA